MSLKFWSITFTETTAPLNVTQKSVEVWLHNKCHKIYLSGPLRMFCLYVILTISYLWVQTIETSSLPTDSSQPLFKQIEIFSILTVWLYISAVLSLKCTRELLECLLGISPSGRNPRGGNNHTPKQRKIKFKPRIKIKLEHTAKSKKVALIIDHW